MKKVVFICRGNMFRSPIAKALYNSMATDGSYAEGYGTAVQNEGRSGMLLTDFPNMYADLETMKNHGWDISAEHCVQLLPEHLTDADKIIVMAEKDYIPAWLTNYEHWTVLNPTSVTPEITEQAIDILKEKISILLAGK